MRRQILVFLVGGICVLTVAGLTSSMVGSSGPTAADVSPLIDSITITVPEQTAEPSGGQSEVNKWLVLAVSGVLGLWLLGVVRIITDKTTVVLIFVSVSGVALLALYLLLFSIEQTGTGMSIDIGSMDQSLLVNVVTTVLLGVVLVTGAIMLIPPSEFRSTTWKPMALLLAAIRDVVSLSKVDSDKDEQVPQLDNEVYQAWARFIDRLDKHERLSPGEAARAARDAGLAPDAVDEIRKTFEEVRYGNAAVTEARIKRMQQAIEQLEYPDGEGNTPGLDSQNQIEDESRPDTTGERR